jgi:hypothetical protein
MKMFIASVLIILAVAFGVCLYANGTGVSEAGGSSFAHSSPMPYVLYIYLSIIR